ncbi:hypothetical protein LINGRAHAP2_LOCUS22468 [Linum grandiflorum]
MRRGSPEIIGKPSKDADLAVYLAYKWMPHVMADIITLLIHQGSRMQWYRSIPEYEGGSVTALDVLKCRLSYNTLMYLATKELDYNWVDRMWYLKPGKSFSDRSDGVKELYSDIEVVRGMLEAAKLGQMHLYFELYDNHSCSDGDSESKEDGSSSSLTVGDEGARNVSLVVHEDGVRSLSPSTYRGSSDSDHTRGGSSNNEVLTPYEMQPWYEPTCDHKQLQLKKGLWFTSAQQFRDAVNEFSIVNGYDVIWVRRTTKKK